MFDPGIPVFSDVWCVVFAIDVGFRLFLHRGEFSYRCLRISLPISEVYFPFILHTHHPTVDKWSWAPFYPLGTPQRPTPQFG